YSSSRSSDPTASRFRRSEPSLLREEKIGRHLATRRSFHPRARASPRDCPRSSCILRRTLLCPPHETQYRARRWQLECRIFLATREKMGTSQDERIRRTAINFCWVTRRVYYGTLLGIHMCAGWLQRIPRGTSALENLEREHLRIPR